MAHSLGRAKLTVICVEAVVALTGVLGLIYPTPTMDASGSVGVAISCLLIFTGCAAVLVRCQDQDAMLIVVYRMQTMAFVAWAYAVIYYQTGHGSSPHGLSNYQSAMLPVLLAMFTWALSVSLRHGARDERAAIADFRESVFPSPEDPEETPS